MTATLSPYTTARRAAAATRATTVAARAAQLLRLYQAATGTGVDRAVAPCSTADPDAWFSEVSEGGNAVKRTCLACPLVSECLADAVDRDEPFGVWGSATRTERLVLQRRLGLPARWR